MRRRDVSRQGRKDIKYVKKEEHLNADDWVVVQCINRVMFIPPYSAVRVVTIIGGTVQVAFCDCLSYLRKL